MRIAIVGGTGTVGRHGTRAVVVPLVLPGAAARAMRRGTLLPSEGARIEGPTFEQWLAAGGDRPPGP